MVQVRVPEEILRKLDRLVQEGLYRSRSEIILDATRRFLERSTPSHPLELFIDKYLAEKIEPSTDAIRVIDEIFGKVRRDEAWKIHFGRTPEEVLEKLRRRFE
ncbi:MAG: ribbon-helix-helix domain-containing protein [Candidatus Bathyarchaeia archaeon]